MKPKKVFIDQYKTELILAYLFFVALCFSYFSHYDYPGTVPSNIEMLLYSIISPGLLLLALAFLGTMLFVMFAPVVDFFDPPKEKSLLPTVLWLAVMVFIVIVVISIIF